MVPVFRHLYEKCMEAGLPIGAAPDIHVSLVMLPEECRLLSDKSYFASDLKLKVLGKAVRFGLNRRLNRLEGAAFGEARYTQPRLKASATASSFE
jgi:hypothetical protein